MKKILPVLSGFLLILTACKKEPSDSTPAIIATTSDVKVINGQKVGGALPTTSSSNKPIVDLNPFVRTLAGKYAIFEPATFFSNFQFNQNPAGYYVQVEGDTGYYKIDYRNAATLYKRFIVLEIPQNLSAGDFRIIVKGFDSVNNVSDTIGARIQVDHPSASGNVGLQGTWKYTKEKTGTGPWVQFSYDTTMGISQSWNCVNNKITTLHHQQDPYPTVFFSAYKYLTKKWQQSFTPDGAGLREYIMEAFLFDANLSGCDNIIYKLDIPSSINQALNTRWSSTNNSLTLYYQIDLPGATISSSSFEDFEIVEQTSVTMILKAKGGDYWIEMSKI